MSAISPVSNQPATFVSTVDSRPSTRWKSRWIGLSSSGASPNCSQVADDGDREIVVDVGGHAGERELDRLARLRPGLDERPPGDRAARAGVDRRLGVEVEASEDDVEAVDEVLVLELGAGAGGVDGERDLEIEPVEDRDSVLARERAVDRFHLGDHLRDRRHVIPGAHDAILTIPTGLARHGRIFCDDGCSVPVGCARLAPVRSTMPVGRWNRRPG